MSAPILLLFGTQTGTTEQLAHSLARVLEAGGQPVTLLDLADAYPELLSDCERLILCTSTWIEGSLPNNAVDFYEGLQALQPDLRHLRYGLLAVGDRAYAPQVNAAAWKFKGLLEKLGATSVVPPLAFEGGPVSVDPDEASIWVRRCAEAFLKEGSLE